MIIKEVKEVDFEKCFTTPSEAVDMKDVASITWDIETGALPQAELEEVFEAKTYDEFVGRQRWKPETAAAKYADYLKTAFSEFQKNAAKSALTGRVLAIGYRIEMREGDDVVVINHGEEEAVILEQFWDTYQNCEDRGITITGWNILRFDIPFCVQRSRVNGVAVPAGAVSWWKGRASFNDDIFNDAKVHWTFGDITQNCSAEQVARTMGIKGFKVVDGVKYDGGDFERLYYADLPTALEYLIGDVNVEFEIAKKLNVI